MSWYAATPARRFRQAAGDLMVSAWVAGCVLAGRGVQAGIAALAEPGRALQAASRRVDTGLEDARGRVDDVPLVGDRLRDAFAPLTAATDDVDRAAADFAATVERLALTAGLLAALVPTLLVALPWLWWRLRFARRAAALRAFADQTDHLDLLALRALSRRPPTALVRLHPDPAGAWRRADPTVIRDLAALELLSYGVRSPSRARPGA